VSDASSSGGIGFFGALFLVLLTLKLAGVIGWSWWWVTAPLWGPTGLLVAAGLIALVVVGVMALVAWIMESREERAT
jgi:hypothetical protein